MKKPIPAKEEKNVQISEMYVYPVRGIRAGCQVDSLEVGRYGVKYDREIVLVDQKDKKIVTVEVYTPMACLSQVLNGNQLEICTSLPERLSEKGLSATL